MATKILLSYDEPRHKKAIADAEAIADAFNELVTYTTQTAKIEITDLESFEAEPFLYTTDVFWESYKNSFTAPIDQHRALGLTAYEKPHAQLLYGRYMELKALKPNTNKDFYCSYVGKGKEEFYKDAKSLEDAIKEMRAKYPEYKIRSLEMVRGIPFFKWDNGIDFTLSPSNFI